MSSRLLALLAVVAAIVVLAAGCGGGEEGAPGIASPPVAGGPSPEQPALEIAMVPTIRFDKEELQVPADEPVTLNVDNRDTGVPHNFAVYESEEDADAGKDPLFATDICDGPCQDTLVLKIDAGEYFFRCDVHPTQMMGKVLAD